MCESVQLFEERCRAQSIFDIYCNLDTVYLRYITLSTCKVFYCSAIVPSETVRTRNAVVKQCQHPNQGIGVNGFSTNGVLLLCDKLYWFAEIQSSFNLIDSEKD